MIPKILTSIVVGLVEWIANSPKAAPRKDTTARDAQARWERIKANRALRNLESSAKR